MEQATLITLGPASKAQAALFSLLTTGKISPVPADNVFTIKADEEHRVIIKDTRYLSYNKDGIPYEDSLKTHVTASEKTAFLLTIDLHREASIKTLEKWIERLKKAAPDSPIILVGMDIQFPGGPTSCEIGVIDFAKLAITHGCQAFIRLDDKKPETAKLLMQRAANHLHLKHDEKGYERIWQKTEGIFIDKIIALLNNYALVDKEKIKLLFHPNRHFRKEVTDLLNQMKAKRTLTERLLFILEAIKNLSANDPYGSLARRVAFIERKLQYIHITPSEDDATIIANLKAHPITQHVNDKKVYFLKCR